MQAMNKVRTSIERNLAMELVRTPMQDDFSDIT